MTDPVEVARRMLNEAGIPNDVELAESYVLLAGLVRLMRAGDFDAVTTGIEQTSCDELRVLTLLSAMALAALDVGA